MDDRATPFDRTLLEATLAEAARSVEQVPEGPDPALALAVDLGTARGADAAGTGPDKPPAPRRAALASVSSLTGGVELSPVRGEVDPSALRVGSTPAAGPERSAGTATAEIPASTKLPLSAIGLDAGRGLGDDPTAAVEPGASGAWPAPDPIDTTQADPTGFDAPQVRPAPQFPPVLEALALAQLSPVGEPNTDSEQSSPSLVSSLQAPNPEVRQAPTTTPRGELRPWQPSDDDIVLTSAGKRRGGLRLR